MMKFKHCNWLKLTASNESALFHHNVTMIRWIYYKTSTAPVKDELIKILLGSGLLSVGYEFKSGHEILYGLFFTYIVLDKTDCK